MKKLHTRFRLFSLLAGVAFLAASSLASADPPSRVARLGYASGAVSFSPAGEEDWVQATINRPLTTGDRLWADAGARAEVQVGGAMIRMSAATSVAVLNLDDSITQLQLTQGTLNVRVRRLDPDQVIEIDTPNLAFTLRQPGDYRLMVDPEGNATSIYVRKGQGEVYGEGASYVVDARQPYRFIGTGLQDYEPLAMAGLDDFDRWGVERDRGYDTSVSARYVSPDVIGYQDLDANGTWRADPAYGNVWIPSRVAAGWAPYRDGHWAWVDPWGWTWVDDAPWGFAVSHYGRWTNLRGTWGWVPGPARSHAYYAPALVAFVGGRNFSLAISTGNVGGIAWFPLGPREVYRPSYAVSRRYFENVNVSNTVINTTVINNYYNNSNVTNVTYVNRQVPGAIVAVPTTAFVQSQPVNRSAVRVTQEMVANAPVANVAAVAPTDKSVRGAAAQREKPPARAVERPVVAHATPPAAPAAFAAQQQQLAATPGKPLDDTERKQLKTDRAAQAAAVRVIAAQPKATAPTAPPPPATAANRPEGGGKDVQRGTPAAGPPPARVAVPNTPTQPPVAGRPPATAAPTTQAEQRAKDSAKSDEQRAKQEQRQQEEQRVRAAARPPSAPQAAAPPSSVPPPQPQREAAQQQQQKQAQQQQQQKEAAQQQQQQKQAQQAQQQQQREAAQQQQQAAQQQQQQKQAEQKQQREAAQQQQQQKQAEQKQQRDAAQQQQQQKQAQQQAAQQQQQQKQAQQQAAQQQQQQKQAQQQQAAPQPQPARESRPAGKGEDKKKDADEEAKPKG